MQNGNQINLEAGGAEEKIILFIINMLEMLFFFVGIGIVRYRQPCMCIFVNNYRTICSMCHIAMRANRSSHMKRKIYLRRFSALPQPFSKKRVINMRR